MKEQKLIVMMLDSNRHTIFMDALNYPQITCDIKKLMQEGWRVASQAPMGGGPVMMSDGSRYLHAPAPKSTFASLLIFEREEMNQE